MNDIEITKLDLVEGGNVFKQGHFLTLGYAPRDRSGQLVNLEGKDVAVSLYNRYGVSYETTARFDAGNLRFDVKTAIPSGEMFVEFTATDPNDESYRMKFPTNPNAAKLSVVPSTDDLGNTGITIYTVDKLRQEQQSAQQQYESTVDGKLSTVEQRLDDGIGAFTEDTEVLDARMGEVNLRAFNEKTTVQLADKANLDYVDIVLATAVSGAPKSFYNTVTALQNAYPQGTDGVFLVLSDGHIYIWNEASWQDAGLYQGAVTTLANLEEGLRNDLLSVFDSFTENNESWVV